MPLRLMSGLGREAPGCSEGRTWTRPLWPGLYWGSAGGGSLGLALAFAWRGLEGLL